MQRLIDRAIMNANRDGYECNQIGLSFFVDGMEDGEFLVPFRPPKENNAAKLTAEMDKFHQSNKEIRLFEKSIVLKITIVNTPVGAGRNKLSKPLKGLNFNSNAILQVPSTPDNLCLFKAVVLATEYGLRKGDPHRMRRLTRLALKGHLADEARQLMRKCAIPENLPHYGMDHVRRVQEFMEREWPQKYNILVFGQHYGEKPVFNGRVNAEHTITLYHHENHFDAVKSPSLLLGKRRYCSSCECTYDRPLQHLLTCKSRCPSCTGMGHGYPEKCRDSDERNHQKCQDCNMWFQTQECYDRHIDNGVCELKKRCEKCKSCYNTKDGHDCDLRWCRTCKTYHAPTKQRCQGTFMRVQDPPEDKDYRIIAYDYECTINEPFGPKRWRHNVNAVSAKVTCAACIRSGRWKDFDNTSCNICGPRKKLYWSVWDCDNPLEEFVEFLFRGTNTGDYETWKKYTTYAYAHNGAKYDSHFTLQSLFNRGGVKPKILSSGNKLLQVHVPSTMTTAQVYVRDSNLLFPMRLDDAPSTFEMSGVSNKSHFPYMFNKEENYDIVLEHLPPKEDYIPSRMSKKDRKKFDEWYDNNWKTRPFNLKQVIKEYCENDSLILIHALVTFRELFNGIAGCDLFVKGVTITSLCLKLYQTRYLKKYHIPIVPPGGYGRADRQSRIALQWLKWLAAAHGINVQHRDSEKGEASIGKYKVDGYISVDEMKSDSFKECSSTYECFLCKYRRNATRNLVVEFNGCAWHGCEHCFANDIDCPNGKKASQNFDDTRKREEQIRKTGVEYWGIQECVVRDELKKNADMQSFFETRTYDTGPLDPRDGFFGGRVHPTRMFYTPSDNEVIKYFDIVSLYPYVLCNREFPVGGKPRRLFKCPGILKCSSSKELPYKGLYKVRVLPPDDIVFPVLPMRDDQRLVFSLCRTCTIESRTVSPYRCPGCQHSKEQRAFISTATHAELGDALDHGYRILEFIEGWKYDKWDSELFTGYMKEFLRIKIEASGWSDDILHAADVEKAKDDMIALHRSRQGLEIRKDRVRKNLGLRYIAKLCANSLWGRLAMRTDKQQVEIVRDPSHLTDLLGKKSIEVLSIIELNDEALRVSYRYKDRFERVDPNNNLVIAMYTTAYGRLELLKYMRMCEEEAGGPQGAKLLYNDTDSVTAVFRKGNIALSNGEFVGDMCDEFPRHTILEFTSGGSKNYGMRLLNHESNKIEVRQKIRGITFNCVTQDLLDYDKQRECVREQPNIRKVSLPNTLILRDRRSNVYTRESTKDYRVYVRKAWIDPNDPEYRNWPYGYNRKVLPPTRKKRRIQ